MSLWRISREELRPLLLIALLPVLIAAPLLLNFLNADPLIYNGGVTINSLGPAVDVGGFPTAQVHAIAQRGSPTIEGNAGITTQALGYRAAMEIVHGRAPWWNAYCGVGLPLAAEYVPAAFFPPTLLLLLPQGMLLEHLLLQILAGWGTYALLRQLSVGRLAALCGGLLYAFNGTLAWYDCCAALPLPFLPWMLFGIERAFVKAEMGLRGGWRIFAVALTLNLLGGFPEAAYLNGLLALAWAVLRLFMSGPEKRLAFVWRVGAGGVAGLALAGPQIFAFFQYLPLSYTLFHTNGYTAYAHEEPIHVVPSLIAPYVFGPIYRYATSWPESLIAWGGLGGYVTGCVLVVAAYGVVARRSAIGWLLLGWTLLALGKSFGVEPAVFLWNLIPGATEAAVDRYVQPTWLLALTLLAAMGLDDLAKARGVRSRAQWSALIVALLVMAASLIFGTHYWHIVRASPGLRLWTSLSLVWATLSAFLCVALLARPLPRWNVQILGALLVIEGVFMFAVPIMSNAPGSAQVDNPPIDFLRRNLGLNRFYTLGPIQPNYGAYFGLASVNSIYVPIPLLWTNWDQTHLDGDSDNVILFLSGMVHRAGKLTPAHALGRNVPALEWAGVKYVVSAPNELTAQNTLDLATDVAGAANPQSTPTKYASPHNFLKKVYADAAMDIFELPHPSPYFEIVSGRCTVDGRERTEAVVDCATPATLLRRELYFPGWTASANDKAADVAKYKDLFQAVALPPGKSTVRFRYAPPHVIWVWLAVLISLIGFVASGSLEFLTIQSGGLTPRFRYGFRSLLAEKRRPVASAASRTSTHRDSWRPRV